MEAPKEFVDIAAAFVAAYDKWNPMRTADMHSPDCDCLRCFRDFAEHVVARTAAKED